MLDVADEDVLQWFGAHASLLSIQGCPRTLPPGARRDFPELGAGLASELGPVSVELGLELADPALEPLARSALVVHT